MMTLLPIFCAMTLGLLEAARASILLSSILYFSEPISSLLRGSLHRKQRT